MGVGKSTFEFTNSSITINGGSTTINITRDNQSYSHKLSHGFGEIATLPVGTTSYDWAPTASDLEDFLKEIPNQKTRQIDVYLDTYNGETKVGRDVHALTVTLSETSGKPSYIGSPTIKDSNTVTHDWSVVIPGKSKLSINDYVLAFYGAKIVKKKYMYSINDVEQTYEYNTLSQLFASLPLTDTPISVKIILKAEDSRGFIVKYTLGKTCARYSDPAIDMFEVIRCDADGNETETGTHAKVILKGTWSSIGGKNAATLKIGIKKQGETDYTYQDISATNGVIDYESILEDDLSADSDYLFAVSITDAFGTYVTDGVGFTNSKNILYVSADGSEVTIGASSESNVLIGPGHVDIRQSEKVLTSFSGEKRTVQPEFGSEAYERNFTSIYGSDNVIISASKEDSDVYQKAEICEYTGMEPGMGGGQSRIILQSYTGGSADNPTHDAHIYVSTIENGRAAYNSMIRQEADYVDIVGNDTLEISGDAISIMASSNIIIPYPVIVGDCNTLIQSGRWYLGNGSTNRPVNKNGWLECKYYTSDYYVQTYTTYTGEIYKRCVNNGTVGIWTAGLGNHVKLWSGTLSPGGSVTIADLPLYDSFLARTSHGVAMMTGNRSYYNNSGNRDDYITFVGAYDDGSVTYLYASTCKVSGTKITCSGCSWHSVGSTGIKEGVLDIKSLWGIM